MNRTQLVTAALISSSLLVSCGARTDSNGAGDAGGGDTQPLFNANGQLLGPDGAETPDLGEAQPGDELKLRVVSDVNSIVTGGTDVATITVLATDINNNAVGETAIQFSSTSGVLQNITPLTDENGEASATLRLPQDYQNQDILVTASASNGNYESSARITASGSLIDALGPDNLIAGDSAELVVRLTAGNGEPIANEAVKVTSSAGNSITPSELFTDADGRVDFLVSSENSSDSLRITALNETVSTTHTFDVVRDLLSFNGMSDTTELLVGRENLVSVNWMSEQQPVAGQALSFSITAGRIVAPSTVVTDADGNASVLVSSNSTGAAKITVEATQGGSPKTNIDVEFVATVPDSLSINATVSRVNISETSTISALVKDRLGNPVKNSEVNFAGEDLKGGQLNPASAVTNSAGIASVTFIAGENATEQNEIEIQATVKGTNISDDLKLSVFKRALNVTLGSTNLITSRPLGTQFGMPMIVQVADGSGTPLEDAIVKVSVFPLMYGKGRMELYDVDGRNLSQALTENIEFTPTRWGLAASAIPCPAEDLDGDRILDSLGSMNEDVNGNGSLDPQDPASLVSVDLSSATLLGGSLRTDSTGSGFFELLYPASNAIWSTVEITVHAEALGVEATDSFRTQLGLPADDINDVLQAPPNFYSPYGVDDRSDAVVVGQVDGADYSVREGCTTSF